jgi:hypothetical protein
MMRGPILKDEFQKAVNRDNSARAVCPSHFLNQVSMNCNYKRITAKSLRSAISQAISPIGLVVKAALAT